MFLRQNKQFESISQNKSDLPDCDIQLGTQREGSGKRDAVTPTGKKGNS